MERTMRRLPILFASLLLLSLCLPPCPFLPAPASLRAQPALSPDDGRSKEMITAFREVALLEAQAAAAEENGRLDEAERALWQTVELIELKGGRQHPAALAKRSVLAAFYERSDRYDEAERLLKQNIEVFEMTAADDRRGARAFDLAEALAAFYERRRRFPDAEAALKWLAAPERTPSAASEPFVNARFATLYARWRRFPDAVAHEQRVAGALADLLARIKPGDPESLKQAGPTFFVIMHLGGLAEAYDLEGRPDLAEATYLRRIDLNDRYRAQAGVTLAENLASFYFNRADHTRAEAVLNRMLAAGKAGVPNATNLLARVYLQAGRPREAERIMKDMLGVYERMTPPPARTIAESQEHIAAIYALQGRHADAERLLSQALEAMPADQQLAPDRAAWLKRHGDALKTVGRDAEARRRYAQAEQILRRSIEDGRNRQALARLAASLSLARYCAEWGRHAEALPLARDALRLSERRYGAGHRMTAAPLQTLADVLDALGNPADARIYALRALEIGERTRGPAHPDTQQSRETLRRIDARLGEQGTPAAKAD